MVFQGALGKVDALDIGHDALFLDYSVNWRHESRNDGAEDHGKHYRVQGDGVLHPPHGSGGHGRLEHDEGDFGYGGHGEECCQRDDVPVAEDIGHRREDRSP